MKTAFALDRDDAPESVRLEAKRLECERELAALNANIQRLATEREQSKDVANQARWEMLASMSPELRTPLHAILGCTQLLRMEGGLNGVQTMRVDAVLAAGKQLLDRVHALLALPVSAAADRAPEPEDQEPCSSAPSGQDATDLEPQAGAGRTLHVLVVDDLAVNRDIASSFLRSAGHQVSLAECGTKALAAIAAVDFDVVLMDLRMPDMGGLEATRRIRALGGVRGDVPVIALSAMAFLDQVEECRAAGMNGHLAKPFTPETLLGAILRAAKPLPPSGPAAPDGEPARLRPQSLISLAALNRRFGRHAADAGVQDEPAGGTAPVPSDPADQAGDQAWIDIVSPWNRSHPRAQPYLLAPPTPAIPSDDFILKLRLMGANQDRRLVGSQLSCEPPPDRRQHELHWLLYVGPAFEQQQSASAVCELWRWSLSAWKSISVPGAHFSAEEMHEQGWRYCGPCADRVAKVEIVPDGIRRTS